MCVRTAFIACSFGCLRIGAVEPVPWRACDAAKDTDHEQMEGLRSSRAVPDGRVAAQPHELFGRVAEVCAYVCGNAAGSRHSAAAVRAEMPGELWADAGL